MIRISAFILATLASVAAQFGSAAQAMEIRQFDTMADADQDEYVADLILGAQKLLQDSGKPDLAGMVHKLFTEKDPQGEASTGMLQFDILLDRARVADLNRIKKDPNAARLEVEHAMILTLKKNNIELPPAFMHVADKFRPKLQPKH
jgi:hypothetical protein